MPASTTRRRGRPSTPILTRQSIVDAAFQVLTESGSAEFSLARVAKRLGVQRPALYNHVAGRDGLVNLMRQELIASHIDTSAFAERGWREAVVPWARSYRDTFARYPEFIALLATVPVADTPSSWAGYEAITRAFSRDGWPLADIVPAIVALENFIIGSALDVVAGPDSLSPGSSAALAPTFASAYEATRADRASPVTDRAFEIGLRALLAGLRAALQEDGENSGPVS